MDAVYNLIREPITDSMDWTLPPTLSWWTSHEADPVNPIMSAPDRRGNPTKGMEIGTGLKAVATEIDGVSPGDTVRLYLLGNNDGNTILAGLYRDRTAAMAEGDGTAVSIPSISELTYIDLETPEGEDTLWLKLSTLSSSDVVRLYESRLSPIEPGAEDDGLGIFSGDTEDTEEIEYQWLGEPKQSTSLAAPPGWEPPAEEPEEPEEPGRGGTVTRIAQRVKTYLKSDEELETIAEHVEVVLAYVYGYTRGRGFKIVDVEVDDVIRAEIEPVTDIESVIVAATGRLTPNPEQLSYYQTGDYSERPAVLAGWTLLERAVLNNYRRTWA